MENKYGIINSGNNTTIGDSNQFVNKQNTQVCIDKSKKYTINVENMVLAWANPYNPEAVLYKRTLNVNDRPMLEKYYNMFKIVGDFGEEYNTTIPMIFYTYVVKMKSPTRYVVLNLIDEFGTKMAAHNIIQNYDLSKYLNKVIKFRGTIYRYNENDNSKETKYGVHILKDSEIEVIEGNSHTLEKPPWDMITEDNPNLVINVEDISNKFNKLDIDRQMDLLCNIENKLNVVSMDMFNVPNLIYPIALTYFLMRDDIYDEIILINNRRHLNIMLTILVDYILYIHPKTIDDLMKIVVYVVLNYLGYDLDNPTDKDKFYAFTTSMGVTNDNADKYLGYAKENVGGIQEILKYIPEQYKTKPGDIHETATIQFIKRLCIELDL